jgi:cation transport ATPase
MDARPPADADNAGAARITMLRLWILGILLLGLLGTVTELVLLGHYEEPLQFVPLVLIVAALPTLWWEFSRRARASRRAMQVLMALFVLAAFLGFAAHFHGSAEYQLELNPDMSTLELLEKILRAKAPPLLAPGMMLQLGLLGLAYVFSDTRFRRSGSK